MSTEQVTKLDPWQSLSDVLITAENSPQSFGKYTRKMHDRTGNRFFSMCSVSYAYRAMGVSFYQLQYPWFRNQKEILEKYGFSKEERNKIRRCTEPNCSWVGRLYSMIIHLNDRHEFKTDVIGRILPAIRDDTRQMPDNLKIRRVISSFQTRR